MASPSLTSRTPVACAGCFGQYPDRDHVDFRAMIDGPQVDPSNPRSPHIDWVVICENCVRAAFKLLPDQADEREQHERERAALIERAEKAEAYADQLEDTLQRRPAPPAARSGGSKRRSRYEPAA